MSVSKRSEIRHTWRSCTSATPGVSRMVRSTAANYARLTEFVAPYNKTLTFPGLPEAWSLDTLTGLSRLSIELQRQAEATTHAARKDQIGQAIAEIERRLAEMSKKK